MILIDRCDFLSHLLLKVSLFFALFRKYEFPIFSWYHSVNGSIVIRSGTGLWLLKVKPMTEDHFLFEYGAGMAI